MCIKASKPKVGRFFETRCIASENVSHSPVAQQAKVITIERCTDNRYRPFCW